MNTWLSIRCSIFMKKWQSIRRAIFIKKWQSIGCFIWKERRWYLIIVSGFILLILFLALIGKLDLLFFADSIINIKAWDNLQRLLSIITLAVAIGVWIGEVTQDWDNSLPKKMSVFFVHINAKTGEKRTIMQYEEAYLAGESDIRAWAQQLGKQMTGGELLDFETCLQAHPPKRENAEYKLYEVTIPLTRLPEKYCRKFEEVHGEPCVNNLKERTTLPVFFTMSDDQVRAIHWKGTSGEIVEKFVDWNLGIFQKKNPY